MPRWGECQTERPTNRDRCTIGIDIGKNSVSGLDQPAQSAELVTRPDQSRLAAVPDRVGAPRVAAGGEEAWRMGAQYLRAYTRGRATVCRRESDCRTRHENAGLLARTAGQPAHRLRRRHHKARPSHNAANGSHHKSQRHGSKAGGEFGRRDARLAQLLTKHARPGEARALRAGAVQRQIKIPRPAPSRQSASRWRLDRTTNDGAPNIHRSAWCASHISCRELFVPLNDANLPKPQRRPGRTITRLGGKIFFDDPAKVVFRPTAPGPPVVA